MDYEKYLSIAKNLGAVDAVAFSVDQIVFDPRTILKCMFGCADWGHGHTCPSRPGSLKPWEYEQILKRYRRGIIVHAHDKKTTQRASYEIERQAYIDGHYMAFSLSDCALCADCAGNDGQPCRNAKMARPAFHSVGIDVFATVRAMGLPIETLVDREQQQNWYAACFIE